MSLLGHGAGGTELVDSGDQEYKAKDEAEEKWNVTGVPSVPEYSGPPEGPGTVPST